MYKKNLGNEVYYKQVFVGNSHLFENPPRETERINFLKILSVCFTKKNLSKESIDKQKHIFLEIFK